MIIFFYLDFLRFLLQNMQYSSYMDHGKGKQSKQQSCGSSPWLNPTTFNFFLIARRKATRKSRGLSLRLMKTTNKKFCSQKKGYKKKLSVVAVTQGNTLKNFLLPDDQKKIKGGRLESWRRPSILLFWSLPLKLIHKTWILHVFCS